MENTFDPSARLASVQDPDVMISLNLASTILLERGIVISARSLRNAARSGKPQRHKIAGRCYVTEVALEQFIRSCVIIEGPKQSVMPHLAAQDGKVVPIRREDASADL